MTTREALLQYLAGKTSATLTVADVCRLANVTYTPAWTALNRLVREGVLTTNNATMPHPYHYAAKEMK
jgi:DNA-binding IclR family transcriptional regulator